MSSRPAPSRTAVVTGGGSGIGAATASLLRQRGHSVVVLDRDVTEANDAIRVDLLDPMATETAITEAGRRLGSMDALVLAAGVKVRGTVPDLTLEDWDQCMATNARAPFVCVRAALPLLRQGTFPSIVTVASASAHAEAGALAYAASKGALLSFTRSLALDLLSDGIRVSAVLPGFVETPMATTLTEEQRVAKASENAAGRLVTADDVARAIAFLCSEEAATISGAVLDVGHIQGAFAAPPRAR